MGPNPHKVGGAKKGCGKIKGWGQDVGVSNKPKGWGQSGCVLWGCGQKSGGSEGVALGGVAEERGGAKGVGVARKGKRDGIKRGRGQVGVVSAGA